MKKIAFFSIVLVYIFSISLNALAYTENCHVSDADVHEGYFIKKVFLEHYALPLVEISGAEYKTIAKLPKGIKPPKPEKFKILIGVEYKRPFVLISIPAYWVDSISGETKMISDFTLQLTDTSTAQNFRSEAKAAKVSSASSVLASGTWYKIAVPGTGFYKIDNNFLKKMGVNASSVIPANIRIFGNGGNMLSENNAVPSMSDLVENAVWVSNNGAGTFGTNDFVVFYAVGPTSWAKDSVNQVFVHQNNYYSDSSYYFITFDLGPGLRVNNIGSAPVANETVTDFNDYTVHDLDLVSPAKIGKEWYGEAFGLNPGQNASQALTFNLGSAITDTVICKGLFAAVSGSSYNAFSVSVNGQPLGNYTIPSIADELPICQSSLLNSKLKLSGQTVNVNLSFQSASSLAVGYLDYIELNLRRSLSMSGSQMNFRDWRSVGPGKIANYQLQGANDSTQVWDVSNPHLPVNMTGSNNGGVYSFSQDAQTLHEFAAMNSINLPSPAFSGTVANQDLHGLGQYDYIIVCNPRFKRAADSLAAFHRTADNLSAIVVTTTQVYNEFSSGSGDISAIRNFARMFYDRAGNNTALMPKYLLLFGGASYDYKDRVKNNSNYVPTFESRESQYAINSFCTDDFFGFLDSNEYIENTSIINALDIGVGRLPARSESDASAMLNKIIKYKGASTLGPWRLSATFVADENDDAGNHMQDADAMANCIDGISHHLYNETKVYLDAMQIIPTPAGDRCPDANAAIDNQIYKGTFLLNYNGHGNTELWANERILTADDYNNWTNLSALPFTVTATCDFGQFDQPDFVSAGEQLVLKSDGGVMVGLTTTQASYAAPNHVINIQFLAAQFSRKSDGSWNTFGDAYRIGKNNTYQTTVDAGTIINFRKFSLLGDPALLPDFPQYFIRNDSVKQVKGDGTLEKTDTIGALGAYVIYGSVTDVNNNVLSNFNGDISTTFFDKVKIITAANDSVYKVQDNIVFRGKASVSNGRFSYSFVAPKDINYNFGLGKISSYAQNGTTDAAAADTTISVGGFSKYPVISTAAPIVKPYIGDTLFVNGGITGPNTSLYVSLYDETGINVAGNSVGHDLSGVLDNKVASPYLLNDYYETEANTYKKGHVSFPISGLADGRHSITVRAWDVNDNFGQGTVDFVVVDGKVMEIQGLMSYPNPTKDITHFLFQHNHPDEQLSVQIAIYNTSGTLVRNIKESFMPTGSRSAEISWDGTDNSGIMLPGGLYVYRLILATEKGIQGTGYQKLVLIR